MTRRLLIAVTIAGALLLPAAASTVAVTNPNDRVVPLPFSRGMCQTLIARGAPFQLGGPDTGPGECFIIVVGGGMPGGVAPPEPDQPPERE